MQKTVETIQQSSKYPIDSMDGAGQFIIDIVGKSDGIDSNPISNLMVDQMTLGQCSDTNVNAKPKSTKNDK